MISNGTHGENGENVISLLTAAGQKSEGPHNCGWAHVGSIYGYAGLRKTASSRLFCENVCFYS